MPFCFFFKVNKGTTWDELKQLSEKQERAAKRKLEYFEAACFTVSYDVFLDICRDISVPQAFYQNHSKTSITTQSGMRKCIVICNTQDSKQIILYTAGRCFPLYAGVKG